MLFLRWNARAAACVFLLAFSVRVVHYAVWPGVCIGNDQSEVARIARSLAETGGFANPYPTSTGPTAHLAPVYPAMLSFTYRLEEPARVQARILLNAVFSSLVCVGVFFAGMIFGLRGGAGFAAAVLLACLPPSLPVELCNNLDASLLAMLLVWSASLTFAWWRGLWNHTILLGVIWGLVLLAAPNLLAIFIGFLIAGTCSGEKRRGAFAACGIAILVLSPWMARNRVALGSWFFVRDNAGLELRVSNADEAKPEYNQNLANGAMQVYHPALNPGVAARIAEEGETHVFGSLGRDARQWILAHPGRFAFLAQERARYFWLFTDISPAQSAFRITLLILALCGCGRLYRRDGGAAWSLAGLALLYWVPMIPFQNAWRHRYPIEWTMVLLAVSGVLEVAPVVFRTVYPKSNSTASRPPSTSNTPISMDFEDIPCMGMR